MIGPSAGPGPGRASTAKLSMDPLFQTLRSLVLWAFLLGVPLAALIWTPAGEVVDAFLADRLREYIDWGGGRGRSAKSLPADPPRGASPARALATPRDLAAETSPLAQVPRAAPPAAPEIPPSPFSAGEEFTPLPPLDADASGGAAAPVSDVARAGGWNPSNWSRASSGTPRGAAQPVNYQTPAGTSPAPAGPLVPVGQGAGAAPAAAPGAPLANGEPFASRFARLQELGAQYYLLETWGSQPGQFRFHAKLALTPNSAYTRQFEATAADPLVAVEQVLREVEAWRRQTR